MFAGHFPLRWRGGSINRPHLGFESFIVYSVHFPSEMFSVNTKVHEMNELEGVYFADRKGASIAPMMVFQPKRVCFLLKKLLRIFKI